MDLRGATTRPMARPPLTAGRELDAEYKDLLLNCLKEAYPFERHGRKCMLNGNMTTVFEKRSVINCAASVRCACGLQ